MGWTELQRKVDRQGKKRKIGEAGILEGENATDATGTSSAMGLAL